ncbi:MAG: zinc-binding alcohol dehydrogenase [Candidatus Heimdallarchaeota archaeon]|nr:MAG: zinc-binding alcohol dehydrogenase [Candidatus Heimdallarchaeota archaeon]
MKAQHIIFPSPDIIELEEFEFDITDLGKTDIAIETEFSIVSTGTELAILKGIESWAPLPFVPGYGSIGKIIAMGKAIKQLKIGDRVFTFGKHTSHGLTSVLTLPVPDGLDSLEAVITRMAAVSITANRVSQAELGDYVSIFGLGLVGNLSAQLFALQGCEVIGIDISQSRLDLAKKCGIKHTINPLEEDINKEIYAITNGEMCSSVIEATGLPSVAEQAITCAGVLGELILLGSPREEYQTNLTDFLNRSHLMTHGCITIKGALEWRFPVKRNTISKHSIERNLEIIFKFIQGNKLKVSNLITHVLSPSKCKEAYEGLKNNKDEYIGVIFDWKK